MGSENRRSNGRRRLRNLAVIFVFCGLAVVAIIYVFPGGHFRRQIDRQIASWLVSEFGAGSQIEELRLGWHHVTLHGVQIPLDGRGERLYARTIELEVNPIRLIAHPAQLQRMIRRIEIHGIELHLSADSRIDSESLDRAWIPRTALSPSFFENLASFDSLRQLSLDSCGIYWTDARNAERVLCDFAAEVTPDSAGVFHLLGHGIMMDDSAFAITLTGSMGAKNREFNLQAVVDVPSGPIPGLESAEFGIETNGIRAALRVQAEDSVLDLLGSANLHGCIVRSPAGRIAIDSLRLGLSRDSLQILPFHFSRHPFQGKASGLVFLHGHGPLQISGEAYSDRFPIQMDSTLAMIGVEGGVNAEFDIKGDLHSPTLAANIAFPNLRLLGSAVDFAHTQIALAQDRIEIEEFSLTTDQLRADACGSIDLESPNICDFRGSINVLQDMSVFGWKSAVRTINLECNGTILHPEIHANLISAGDTSLGDIYVAKPKSVWQASVSPVSGAEGRMQIVPDRERTHVVVDNAQSVITMLFPEASRDLQYIRSLDLDFVGGVDTGGVELTAEVIPDSARLWTQIAKEVRFDGQYDRTQPGRAILTGRWSGMSADRENFRGRGEVTLDHRLMTITRLFVDDVGELSGSVDFADRKLNMQLQLSNLTASRLPFKPAFVRRVRLHGGFSGFFEIHGPFEDPLWTASLAMIDGEILDVPGYWINLESEGHGSDIRVQRFEVGRGVRKIATVTGDIKVANDSLALSAEVGSARAEDFLLALTGKSSLFSGELAGRATINGAISKPDIKAELTIHDGLMLNAIHVDEFLASFETDTAADGTRLYRLPQCSFYKQDKYEFSCSAAVGARDESLKAHIEGNGDFLDLVDQLDRTFRSEGSDGTVRLELGGTIRNPILLEGTLDLTDGQFSYADATPNLVSTEISISVATGGVSKSGYIRFETGDQWLRIMVVPVAQSTVQGLDPLVIPLPRLTLGVLEVTSSVDGFPLRFPGLMKSDWYGPIAFGSSSGIPLTISGWDTNRLLIGGQLDVRNSRMTFPFTGGGGHVRPVAQWILNRLIEAKWDLGVSVEVGNHYDVEITGLKNSEMFAPLKESPLFETLADYIDHLTIDAIVDPSDSPIGIRGTIEDSTFHLVGRLSSSRGTVEYLDQTFKIDYVTADFDETNVMPILEGRAVTEGIDSLGRQVPVYLTMYQIDRETDIRQKRGRLDKVTFVLETETGETPEQVLQLLGYDIQNVGGKAGQLVATTFARVIGRQWLDPLERQLERWTLLDEIAFNPGGGRTSALARQQRVRAASDTLKQSSAIRFFTGSQVTVGKYITPDLFVTYTGELAEGQIDIGSRVGLVHLWNLEYRMEPLSRDLVLDFAVEYDEVERKRDESVSIKYSFALEP